MLKEYREEIRELDEKILELIERRLEIARTIAEYKMDRDIPVTDAAQEENVIDHVVSLAKREDDVPYIRRFWRMMLENSRAVQHKVVTGDNITGLWLREMIRSAAKRKENPRVVYKGGEGSYGHEAAEAYFGKGGFGGCSTYEKVCRAVKNGDADYAVLPLESNTAGAMPGVRELINKYGLYIAGEQNVRLDDCLAAPKGAKLEDITEIHAHEQVLSRCSAFLEDHPEIRAVPSLSSSKCVKKIAEENSPHKAVITSGFAAELNGLEVIAPYVSDNPGSCTRFVILTDKFEISPGGNKVSMAFTVRHRAGALQRVLGIFADYHLNLSKIESVPVGGADFEYLFFTDFTGDIAQANTQKALALVEQECDFLRILGNYKSKRRNIVLVGMPGSGKNAVGKALALQIGMEYYDTDALIEEQEGKDTTKIFAENGEKYFRDAETEMSKKVSSLGGAVISTGGGTMMRPENARALRRTGYVFFVNRPVEEILESVDLSNRPLLAGDPKQIYKLYADRLPTYRAVADYEVRNDGELSQVVNALDSIIELLKGGYRAV